MTRGDVLKLYCKEREYQTGIFGSYSTNSALSFPSFLVFLKEYIRKAAKAYTGTWTRLLPDWLLHAVEIESGGTAPVKAYEELVKIFALSGAALEAYCEIDVEQWRKEGVNPKWLGGEPENG